MPFDLSPGPVKPAAWDWNPSLLSPMGRQLCDRLITAFPHWEGAGGTTQGYGKSSVTSTITDQAWSQNTRGNGLLSNKTATGDGVRLNTTFEDYIDISSSGSRFSVVFVCNAAQWNEFGVLKYFCGARNTSSQGWAFLVNAANVQIQIPGQALYTVWSVGVDAGQSKVIGFNVTPGGTSEGFENGVSQGTVSTGTGTKAGVDMALWSFWDGTQSRLETEWDGVGNAAYFFDDHLTDAEHAALGDDPYLLIRPDASRILPIYWTEAAAAGGGTPYYSGMSLMGVGV